MGNWLHHLWFSYAVPSLYGNGPEDLIRTTIALVLAALIVPRIRHWFEAREERLHAKLDHIIRHHPDIPEFEAKK